jgi:hypothetical protein
VKTNRTYVIRHITTVFYLRYTTYYNCILSTLYDILQLYFIYVIRHNEHKLYDILQLYFIYVIRHITTVFYLRYPTYYNCILSTLYDILQLYFIYVIRHNEHTLYDILQLYFIYVIRHITTVFYLRYTTYYNCILSTLYDILQLCFIYV